MIMGYKCFNANLTNHYGFQFEVGKTYSVSGDIKAGTTGNGYHMCINMEDTFRFYGEMNENIKICEVIGTGNMVRFSDEYNGYFDMYSVEHIEIVRVLSREEIVEIGLSLGEMRVIRFISGFRLTPEEIELFKEKYKFCPLVIKAIAYYQEGDKFVYQRGYTLKKELVERRIKH
jgi:hypothetical protein